MEWAGIISSVALFVSGFLIGRNLRREVEHDGLTLNEYRAKDNLPYVQGGDEFVYTDEGLVRIWP